MPRPILTVRGFTLIEILVCLALMALIATILLSSLQLGGHSWQRVVGTSAATNDIAQAQDFLRARLSEIYPEDPLSPKAISLVARDGSLEFLGMAPNASSKAVLRYQIALSSSGDLEVRASEVYRRAAFSSAQVERLLSHVQTMTVRFWQQRANGTGAWANQWQDSLQIPRLIEIDVRFSEKDRRYWPPLYIEPRLDTPVSCQFDVVSRRCRSKT
jgi:general secretion pathway protein J